MGECVTPASFGNVSIRRKSQFVSSRWVERGDNCRQVGAADTGPNVGVIIGAATDSEPSG